jgi:heat shock protein HslJ
MAPTAIGYECPDRGKPFFATFYQETDPPSVVLTYGNDQVIAFLAPTASGAKYVATNMEFREHYGEASVEWYGTKMTCKRLPGGRDPAAGQKRLPLGGTAWKLVEFQSMDDITLKPESGATYTLVFERDGRVRIQSDCNRAQGPWRSPDNVRLELGPFAATLMHCRSALSDAF